MAGNNKNFAVDEEEIESLRRIKDDSRDHWHGETERPEVVDLLIERGMLSAKWQEESSTWHGNLTVTAFGNQFLRLLSMEIKPALHKKVYEAIEGYLLDNVSEAEAKEAICDGIRAFIR